MITGTATVVDSPRVTQTRLVESRRKQVLSVARCAPLHI